MSSTTTTPDPRLAALTPAQLARYRAMGRHQRNAYLRRLESQKQAAREQDLARQADQLLASAQIIADGARIVVQHAEAQREAVVGIESYWRGACTCHGAKGKSNDKGEVLELGRPACAHAPDADRLIDRYGGESWPTFDGRRVPEPFLHLWVFRYWDEARQEHVRLVRGQIADDCLAQRHTPADPEITAMTEPEQPRDAVYRSAYKLPAGEALERSGLRRVKASAIRGVCPGCGDPQAAGPLCLACDNAATNAKLEKLLALPELSEVAKAIPAERVRGGLKTRKALVRELVEALHAIEEARP